MSRFIAWFLASLLSVLLGLALLGLAACASGQGTGHPADAGGAGGTGPSASSTGGFDGEDPPEACRTVFVRYVDPGSDARWGTADDEAASALVYEFDAAGVLERYYLIDEPGPDGAWGSADDPIGGLRVLRYDARGRWTGHTHYLGPGPDGQWNSADDEPDHRIDFVYDDAALQGDRRDILVGPDGLLDTADDVVGGRMLAQYEGGFAFTDLSWTAYYDQPGPDETWGTSDDPISFTHTFVHDGWKRKLFVHTAPGADALWLTSDDPVSGLAVLECLEQENTIGEIGHGDPGADGVWDTDDDPIASRWVAVWDGCDSLTCGHLLR